MSRPTTRSIKPLSPTRVVAAKPVRWQGKGKASSGEDAKLSPCEVPCRPSETDTYPDQVQFTELGASSINKGVLLREFGVAERESLQLLDDLGRMCTNHVSLFEDVISTPAGILPYPSDVSVLLSELNKLEDALTGLTGRMTVQAAQLQGKRDDLGYDEGEADDDDRATLESMAQLRDRITALLIPFAQLLQQSQDCEGVPEDECFDRLEFLRRGGWIYDEDRKLCGSVQDRPVLIDMPGVAASFQGENGLVMLDVLTPVLRKLSAYFADEHAAFGLPGYALHQLWKDLGGSLLSETSQVTVKQCSQNKQSLSVAAIFEEKLHDLISVSARNLLVKKLPPHLAAIMTDSLVVTLSHLRIIPVVGMVEVAWRLRKPDGGEVTGTPVNRFAIWDAAHQKMYVTVPCDEAGDVPEEQVKQIAYEVIRLLLNKVPSLSLEALSFAQQLESLVAEELFGVMHNPANALQLVQQAVQEAKLRVGVDDMPHYDTRMRSYQITAPQLLSDVLDPSSVSRPLPWHTLNNQYIDVSKFKDARELMRFALTAPNLTWPVCIELSPIMKLLMPMERLPADLKPHEQVGKVGEVLFQTIADYLVGRDGFIIEHAGDLVERGLPYDIVIRTPQGTKLLVDVKSTSAQLPAQKAQEFKLSITEYRRAQKEDGKYYLARFVSVPHRDNTGDGSLKLVFIQGPILQDTQGSIVIRDHPDPDERPHKQVQMGSGDPQVLQLVLPYFIIYP